MNGRGKSDRGVVPAKPPNKALPAGAAEAVEGRPRAEGNPGGQNAPRTQGRVGALSALDRIREAARRDGRQRFTALLRSGVEDGQLAVVDPDLTASFLLHGVHGTLVELVHAPRRPNRRRMAKALADLVDQALGPPP